MTAADAKERIIAVVSIERCGEDWLEASCDDYCLARRVDASKDHETNASWLAHDLRVLLNCGCRAWRGERHAEREQRLGFCFPATPDELRRQSTMTTIETTMELLTPYSYRDAVELRVRGELEYSAYEARTSECPGVTAGWGVIGLDVETADGSPMPNLSADNLDWIKSRLVKMHTDSLGAA